MVSSDGSPWRFRVARGVAAVRDGAITVRSTPRSYLAGTRARWRHGDRRTRARIAAVAAGACLSLVAVAGSAARLADAGVAAASLVSLVSLAAFGYGLLSRLFGATAVPLSAIESARLDPGDRTLSITHAWEGSGPLSVLREDPAETTLRLPGPEDCRRAREVLRLRGVDVEVDDGSDGSEPSSAPDPTRRVDVKWGATFCEACGSQVSPADAACPACGAPLRASAAAAAE